MQSAFRVSRRQVVVGAGATGVATGFAGVFAHPEVARAAGDARAVFLAVSRILTARADLGSVLADRLFDALTSVDPSFPDHLTALAAAAGSAASPQDALARAKAAGIDEVLHQIVAAWYTGSAALTLNAPMVAYYDALMYRPTHDGLPVPTYCFAEPGWWTQDPPALGIPAVAPKPVTPPAPPPVAVETKPPPVKHVAPVGTPAPKKEH